MPHEYELPPDADPDDDDRWQLPCPQCGHPESHIVHMACEWETDPNDPRACINCGERWEFAGAHAAYEAYRIAVEEGRPWRPGAA